MKIEKSGINWTLRVSVALVFMFGFLLSKAQTENEEYVMEGNQVLIPPLFEYVVAPDELPDLQSRTDYIMDHFWDPFDFKNKKIVDQNALNHAFEAYVGAIPYASSNKVEESIGKLISKIKNNPGLSFQFTKAAEESFYGPRSEFLGVDGLYMKFLKNLLDNKKVKDSQKKRYADQYRILSATEPGQPLPSFEVTNILGTVMNFAPSKEMAVIGFIPENFEDQRYQNLKLDISSVVNDLLEDGKLEVDLIYLQDGKAPADLPSKWNVFSTSDTTGKLDIRRIPCFYVIGKNKEIVAKNVDVDEAINIVEAISKQQ